MSLWILIITLIQQGVVRCAVKTWSANTNYDNINNWDQKRIPCGQDRVIFPPNDNVSVYMPKSAIVRELVLPNTGVLIFPTDSSLIIGGDVSKQSSCPGEDVKFIGGKRQDRWYDSYNWNVSSEFAINLADDKDLLPVPHSDQVPCENDDVVFPRETAFKLHFDGDPIKIGSLSINGKMLGREDFNTFISTETGKALFVNPPQVDIRTQTCSNIAGCICGNDRAQIMSKICSIVAPKCPKLQCSDPIQITGHCCRICGSSLVMEYKEGFSFAVLARLIASYLRKNEYRTVQGYTSKTHENKIQTVFVDARREKRSAHKASKDILGYLMQDIEDQQIYNLKSAVIESAINWLVSDTVTHSPHSDESAASAGTTVGIVFAVLIAIVLAVVVFLFYRKRRIPGFTFARFDHSGSKIEMELGTTPHDVLDPIASSSSPTDPTKGFDNPMYEKSTFSLTNPSYKTLKDEEKKTSDYRENPAYMVLED